MAGLARVVTTRPHKGYFGLLPAPNLKSPKLIQITTPPNLSVSYGPIKQPSAEKS